MAKAAAKAAPTKKPSPVMLMAGLGGLLVVYLLLNPAGSSSGGSVTAAPRKKSAKDASGFTLADYDAQKNPFPSATVAAIDAFNPVVKKKVLPPRGPVVPEAPGSAIQIPVTLTGGEANWYFTGCPSTDGVRTALFENTASGESVYLRAGEAFKAARVQTVDLSTVVLTGPNGVVASVPIVGFGEVPGGSKTVVATNGPLPLPTGAIGGPLPPAGGRALGGPNTATLNNGQTVQLPANLAPGAGNDLNVAPDTNSNNGGGRRRRRNRNQNFGDPNNGQ